MRNHVPDTMQHSTTNVDDILYDAFWWQGMEAGVGASAALCFLATM